MLGRRGPASHPEVFSDWKCRYKTGSHQNYDWWQKCPVC